MEAMYRGDRRGLAASKRLDKRWPSARASRPEMAPPPPRAGHVGMYTWRACAYVHAAVRPRAGSATKREDVAPRVNVHACLCGNVGLAWRARVRMGVCRESAVIPVGRAHVGIDLEGSVERKLVRVRGSGSRVQGADLCLGFRADGAARARLGRGLGRTWSPKLTQMTL